MRPAFEVECQHKFRCRLQALPSRLKNPIHCSEHGQVKRKLNAAIFGESHARNCGSRSGTGARGGWFQLGTTNLRASRRSSFDQANPPDSLEILLEFSPVQKPNGPTRMDPYIMTPIEHEAQLGAVGIGRRPPGNPWMWASPIKSVLASLGFEFSFYCWCCFNFLHGMPKTKHNNFWTQRNWPSQKDGVLKWDVGSSAWQTSRPVLQSPARAFSPKRAP